MLYYSFMTMIKNLIFFCESIISTFKETQKNILVINEYKKYNLWN